MRGLLGHQYIRVWFASLATGIAHIVALSYVRSRLALDPVLENTSPKQTVQLLVAPITVIVFMSGASIDAWDISVDSLRCSC